MAGMDYDMKATFAALGKLVNEDMPRVLGVVAL